MVRTLPLLMLLFSVRLVAEAPLRPYLLKDLQPATARIAGDVVAPAAVHGNTVFFEVTSGAVAALWQSDGTQEGTHRVPEWRGVPVPDPVWMDGFLYYPSHTPTEPLRIFRTDGTTPGTKQIMTASGWRGGGRCGAGKLCFTNATDRVSVWDEATGEVTVLDGTSTPQVPGLRLVASNGRRILFNSYDESHGLCWTVTSLFSLPFSICGELWTSDGTPAGTHPIDLIPGADPSTPRELFAAVDGRVYFLAGEAGTRVPPRLWVTDGTAAGTKVLLRSSLDWLYTPRFRELGGLVYFYALDGVWVTDGTEAGTRSLRPLIGAQSGMVGTLRGRMLLLTAEEAKTNLWLTDGRTVERFATLPFSAIDLGYLASTGRHYFAHQHSHATSTLWSTDGTAEGTKQEFDVSSPFGSISMFAVTPTHLFFKSGTRLHVTDGTEAGTRPLDLSTTAGLSSLPLDFVTAGDRAFFRTNDYELYATDGTPAGTVQIAPNISSYFVHEGRLYFYGQDHVLKTSDGTVGGTRRVTDWLRIPSISTQPPAFIGTSVVYAPDNQYDASLTVQHANGMVDRLGGLGQYSELHSIAAKVVTWRYDQAANRSELIVTDGTAGGTTAVATLSQRRGPLAPVGSGAFFAGPGSEQSIALWTTDLTAAGTRVVKQIPARSIDQIIPLTQWRGLFLFAVAPDARSASFGSTVWRSDGTADGTYPLSSVPFRQVIATADELVLLRRNSGEPFFELWTSHGTAATTTLGFGAPDLAVSGLFLLPNGKAAVAHSVGGLAYIRGVRDVYHVVDLGDLGALHPVVANGRLIFPNHLLSMGTEPWAVSLDGSRPATDPNVVRVRYVGTGRVGNQRTAIFRISLEVRGGERTTVIASTADGSLTAGRHYVPFTREVLFHDRGEQTLVVPLRGTIGGTMSIVLSTPVNGVIGEGLATAVIPGEATKRRAVR